MNLIDFYKNMLIKINIEVDFTPVLRITTINVFCGNSKICTYVVTSTWELKMDEYLRIEEMNPDTFETTSKFTGTDIADLEAELDSLCIELDGISISYEAINNNMGHLDMLVEVNHSDIDENTDNYFELIDVDNYDIEFRVPRMNIKCLTRHARDRTARKSNLGTEIALASFPLEKIVKLLLIEKYEKYSIEII